jgi:hypothetical protein
MPHLPREPLCSLDLILTTKIQKIENEKGQKGLKGQKGNGQSKILGEEDVN